TELFIILKDIILPVFVIMAFGFWMERKFQLNVQTLAKLNIYFLVPGFIFVKLYSTSFSFRLFGKVLIFFIIYIIILYLLAVIISKVRKSDRGEKTAFSNRVMFFNSGTYDVPVNDPVFKSDPFA